MLDGGAAAVVLAPLDRSRGRSNCWCVHVMMQSASSGPRDFGALPIYSSLSKPWLASRASCEWQNCGLRDSGKRGKGEGTLANDGDGASEGGREGCTT